MANYFKSEDVKVYPCQFRGNGIDVKSSLMTEEGLVNGSSLGSLASSYIVSYDDVGGTLKCVICGYYFEIHNLSNYSNWNHLKIELGTINVGGEETIILSSLDKDADNVLDKTIGGESYFIGLSYESTGQLKVFDENGEIAKESILPKFTDTGAISQEDNDNAIGAWSAKLGHNTTTGTYAIAAGNGSSAMGEASAAFNSSTASASRAFAANSGEATGENSFSTNVSAATGTKSFAANDSDALGNSSAAFNLAEAKNDNEFACGKFNESTADTTIFTVGNGTEGDRKNAFEIDKDDSAKFAGDVTISGEAHVAGQTKIDGKLIVNDSGADINGNLNVYGNVNVRDDISAKNITVNEIKIKNDGEIDAKKVVSDAVSANGEITGQSIQIKKNSSAQKKLVLSDTEVTIAYNNNNSIKIESSQTKITGNAEITKNLSVKEDLTVTGEFSAKGGISVDGDISAKDVSADDITIANSKTLTFKGQTDESNAKIWYGRGRDGSDITSKSSLYLNAHDGVTLPQASSAMTAGNFGVANALNSNDISVAYDSQYCLDVLTKSGNCTGYAMKIGQNGKNGIYQIWGTGVTAKEDHTCRLTFPDGSQIRHLTVTPCGTQYSGKDAGKYNWDYNQYPHLIVEYNTNDKTLSANATDRGSTAWVLTDDIADKLSKRGAWFDFMAIVEWPNH